MRPEGWSGCERGQRLPSTVAAHGAHRVRAPHALVARAHILDALQSVWGLDSGAEEGRLDAGALRRARARAAPTGPPSNPPTAARDPLTGLRRRAAALAAAAVVALGAGPVAAAPPPPPPLAAADPARLAVQRTMVQAWDSVARGFVDARPAGGAWGAALETGLAAAAAAADAPSAYREIGAMLARLGDPYTRIVSPE